MHDSDEERILCYSVVFSEGKDNAYDSCNSGKEKNPDDVRLLHFI